MAYVDTRVIHCPKCCDVRAGHVYSDENGAKTAIWLCPVCGGPYDPAHLETGFTVSP